MTMGHGTFLSNKVAVVTGGGTGIGRAISNLFAAEGAHVLVNYARSKQAADDTVKEIQSNGGAAIAVRRILRLVRVSVRA